MWTGGMLALRAGGRVSKDVSLVRCAGHQKPVYLRVPLAPRREGACACHVTPLECYTFCLSNRPLLELHPWGWVGPSANCELAGRGFDSLHLHLFAS